MTYTLRLLTSAVFCALAAFTCYCYLCVATYSDACASVVCQVMWR
jgi:hypothetical protein